MKRSDAMLAGCGALLWLVGLLLWRCGHGIDIVLSDALRATRGTAPARAMAAVTFFGDYGLLILPTVVGALLLARRGDRQAGGWLLAVTLSGRLVTEAEKWLFARPRPPFITRLVEVHSASFPSAHAFNTLLVGLALAAAFRGGRAAYAAAAVFSLAVGFSRLALGVHWPSDVLAGWGSALFWMFVWRPLLQAPTRSG